MKVNDYWPLPVFHLLEYSFRNINCTLNYTTQGDKPSCSCNIPRVSLRERKTAWKKNPSIKKKNKQVTMRPNSQ